MLEIIYVKTLLIVFFNIVFIYVFIYYIYKWAYANTPRGVIMKMYLLVTLANLMAKKPIKLMIGNVR